MSITVIYSRDETDHTISVAKKKLILIPVVFVLTIAVIVFFIQRYYQFQLTEFKMSTVYERNISKDKYLKQIKTQSDEKLMLLSTKLGELTLEVDRLNALGKHIIKKSNLPAKEFNFLDEKKIDLPKKAQSNLNSNTDESFSTVLNKIEVFSDYLKNRKNKLQHLDITMDSHHIKQQLYLSGYPVVRKNTWLSSKFGIREDPFSGVLRMHKGVDIAGAEGTIIHATSAGVVVWAGKRSGYGIMVEINHGQGLVTRYAHAKAVNVKVGSTVQKGQQVAEMGSTGRSTGPHVHYEVIKNGRQVDPEYYIYRKAT